MPNLTTDLGQNAGAGADSTVKFDSSHRQEGVSVIAPLLCKIPYPLIGG